MGVLALLMLWFVRQKVALQAGDPSALEPTPAESLGAASLPASPNTYQHEPAQLVAAAPREEPGPLVGYEAYAEQRIAQLQNLAMSGEADALTTITSELTNRDPAVRQAAVEASVQFGSPQAIPALQEAYTQVDDPQEKINLQKAIELLQLPSALQAGAAAR